MTLSIKHHYQVYSAATSSCAAVDTSTVNGLTKEEMKVEYLLLKEEAVKYNRKICALELMNTSSTRNTYRMELQVRSLLDKLRAAIENLLTLTMMQHNELITKFHDKISDVLKDHDHAIYKLQRSSSREIHDNQKSIEHLAEQHNKQMAKLESEYREHLTHMENQHNKMMVSSHDVLF
jgi:hypothetical protein